MEDALELLLMQDEQVIEALTPHTSEEAFTDGIGTRGVIRGFENLNVTRLRNPREAHTKLGIIITDGYSVSWWWTIRTSLPIA